MNEVPFGGGPAFYQASTSVFLFLYPVVGAASFEDQD